ncbi:MAG: response regulator, partial [Nitrospinaceae bacterium]|nr:response regulator [Nitrospinaceae bacterium]NIR54935.1 response regulator [Nitrospinaceae bacterium]NIS85363.1 response regulator [Nitrospinaceae bacterium]NIT82177.1 response regulator [Nitrospinaceae bacterium]NIU44431.1 response regulator [Nitrospinaceae bacterium]
MGNLQPIPGRDPHLEGGTATLTLDDSPGDQDLILVVDDSEVNRCFLHDRVLTLGHTPILAKNGMEALQQIERQSPSLVLLDIMMPEMNGYQVLERMKADARLQHIPVIMVTAVDDMDSVVRCIQRGAVDYLLKPVNSTLLKARVDAALASKRLHDQEEAYRREIERYNQTLEERVRERTRELEKTRLEVIHRLGRAAEYRDNETGMHVIRMSYLCARLGREVGMSEAEGRLLLLASPMHDVGKIGIPDRILLKADRLDGEEWEIMKTHTLIGSEILAGSESDLLQMAELIALTH